MTYVRDDGPDNAPGWEVLLSVITLMAVIWALVYVSIISVQYFNQISEDRHPVAAEQASVEEGQDTE